MEFAVMVEGLYGWSAETGESCSLVLLGILSATQVLWRDQVGRANERARTEGGRWLTSSSKDLTLHGGTESSSSQLPFQCPELKRSARLNGLPA